MHPEYVEKSVVLVELLNDFVINRARVNRYAVICGSARTSPHNKW